MPFARVSSPLYRTSRWLKMRELQLTGEPLCRYCLQQGMETPAIIADHVTAHRGDADSFWFGELQSLCAPCHDGAKQELERTGRLRGSDIQGIPIDPGHHWNPQSHNP